MAWMDTVGDAWTAAVQAGFVASFPAIPLVIRPTTVIVPVPCTSQVHTPALAVARAVLPGRKTTELTCTGAGGGPLRPRLPVEGASDACAACAACRQCMCMRYRLSVAAMQACLHARLRPTFCTLSYT